MQAITFLTNSVNGDQVKLRDQTYYNNRYGVTEVHFDDGTIWDRADIVAMSTIGTTAGETLYGTPGANVFDGKGGSDYAIGGGGNDTFKYESGYGYLQIDEYDTASTPMNVLSFGTGIDPWEVTITHSGSNVLLTDGVVGDQVKIWDQTYYNNRYGVTEIRFQDGTVWDRSYIAGAQVTGTSGGNTLTGSSGADTFDGRGGTDTVTGGGGDDRYAFNQGYGSLTIDNGGTYGSGAHGKLVFGGGIGASDLWFEQTGSDLVITRIGSSDLVTVDDWFSGDSSKQMTDITLSSGLEIDSGVAALITAMANYKSSNPGFNAVSASSMPIDTGLQSAIASAWHA